MEVSSADLSTATKGEEEEMRTPITKRMQRLRLITEEGKVSIM